MQRCMTDQRGGWAVALLTIGLCASCNEKRPTPTTESAPTASTGVDRKSSPLKDKKMETKRIPNSFESQVAGQFYEADPRILREQVVRFINDAEFEDEKSLAGRDIVGIIAPHAGYVYSGPVAGEAYRAVSGRKYETVVVMALCHRKAAAKISVLNRPGYDTPLGSLAIDKDVVSKLVGEYPNLFESDERVFQGEHSLEVQLPFIQIAVPNAKIVPMIVAIHDEVMVEQAAKALFEVFGDRSDVLFVASTDLTHFLPYDDAVQFDTQLLSWLDNWQIDEWRKVGPTRKGMCGFMPVLTLVSLFQNYKETARQVTLLDYRNSGDTAGDKRQGVVGYGAMAFSADPGIRKKTGPDFGPLTAADRQYLMALAKGAVAAAATHQRFNPPAPPTTLTRDKGAAFVTLKKNGQLRGCIGHVVARIPLFECVASVAKAAAIHDTRFNPVSESELKDLSYEISVLTPPEPTTPDEVVVGRDGLIMSRGGYSGLLLPQVPVEWGWDKDEFLAHTCRKAGLPMNCWQDPDTRIERFMAIVFGEDDLQD